MHRVQRLSTRLLATTAESSDSSESDARKRSVSRRALPEFEPTEQRYEAGAQHAERLVARLKAVQDLQ